MSDEVFEVVGKAQLLAAVRLLIDETGPVTILLHRKGGKDTVYRFHFAAMRHRGRLLSREQLATRVRNIVRNIQSTRAEHFR